MQFKPTKLLQSSRLCYCSHFSVNVCPALSAPVNGKINTTVAIYNTIVKVSCDPGYYFPDAEPGQSSQGIVIRCEADAYWSSNVTVTCSREFIMTYHAYRSRSINADKCLSIPIKVVLLIPMPIDQCQSVLVHTSQCKSLSIWDWSALRSMLIEQHVSQLLIIIDIIDNVYSSYKSTLDIIGQ